MTPKSLDPVKTRLSLADEVHEKLRRAIVLGELEPGSLHSVGDLAEELGVSRTPVREALIRLASRNLVRFERNRGVLILETSRTELAEAFEIRLMIEVPATEKAVERAGPDVVMQLEAILEEDQKAIGDRRRRQDLDRQFHRTLLEQCGNETLVDYVDRLRDMVLVRDDLDRIEDGAASFDDDHLRILECVAAGDARGAAEYVRHHILKAARIVVGEEFQRLDVATEVPQ